MSPCKVDHRQLLDLRRHLVDIAPLGEQAHPGYELVAWADGAPADLLATYARARGAIDDAPHAEGDEWHWTPDVVRDIEAATRARGRTLIVHAVLDGSRKVVAFTELRVSRHAGAVGATEDTAVTPHTGAVGSPRGSRPPLC